MVKLEYLSPNLVLAINELLTNNNIAKYLYYTEKNPLSQPNLADNKVLFNTHIFPYPFPPDLMIEDCTQIRVYYSGGLLKSRVVENSVMIFDVIVAKSLFLVNDGTPAIRPYELANEIVTQFDDKSIGTLGKINFRSFNHMVVNEKFDVVQLSANITTFSKKE